MITRHVQLRDGTIEASEIGPDHWRVMWRPIRDDHPDAPLTVIDSSIESVPATDLDGVVAWAEARFSGRDDRDLVEVTIEEEAAPSEAASIQKLFDAAGTPAIVSARIARRSAGDLPWLIMVETPIGAFLTALAAAAGADAWKALKSFIRQLFDHRTRTSGERGSVELRDASRVVILSPEVSDDGFRQVSDGSLPEGGYYIWDADAQAWRKF